MIAPADKRQIWEALASGMSLIPLCPRDKRPLIKWTDHQKHRADVDTVRQWLKRWPDANLGIVTGAISNVVVVDLDDADAVEWAHAHLPSTPIRVATAKGEHWYYTYPEVTVGCTCGIVAGVDIKGDGGYVVGPGSVHPDGTTYQVMCNVPEGQETPVFNADWFDRPQLPGWSEHVPEGSRNNSAFVHAAWLVNEGMRTRGEAWDALLAWNEQSCDPPLDERELKGVLNSALRRNGGDSVNSVMLSWEPPVPLDLVKLRPFPVRSLPPIMGDFVEATAESVQVPVDLPAMLALAVGAAAAARRFEVHVHGDHVEPTNLWTVCVLPSGARKSSTYRELVQPLLQYEQETGERLVGGDDASPEAVANLLAANGHRMATLSPEGGVFDFMEGRGDGGAGLDVYLKAHAGDDHQVDRVSRDGARLEKPALTLGLTVQPQIISDLMSRKHFRGRGAIARMLFAIPKSMVGHRQIITTPIPRYIRDRYHTAIARAIERGDPQRIRMLRFDNAGLALWREFAEQVERRQAEGEDLAFITDWGSKLAGAVARIAGVMHVVAGRRNSEVISSSTITEAIAIGEYLIQHAQYAFGHMGADLESAGARAILRWVSRERRSDFSRRDAQRALASHFPRAADLDRPLATLIAHRYIRPIAAEHRGRGRPTERYEVNPLTHGQK